MLDFEAKQIKSAKAQKVQTNTFVIGQYNTCVQYYVSSDNTLFKQQRGDN